ncbi:MAG: TIGR04211 family SH3 domain-containing protein [Desulfobacterales bacterium]|nr:TIGR04211 family SH3 domain-containing protein [Desulfobacterales bacterium]
MIKNNAKKLSGYFIGVPLSLTLLLSCCVILVNAPPVVAENRYVKPSSEVVLRRGQGNDYRIVAMVKDGDSVEFLEEGESYAKVRLENGKEGWMLKRFLSEDPPLQEVVASLRVDKENLKQRELGIIQKLEEASSALEQTESKLDIVSAEKDQITIDYQSLKRDTAGVTQIKKDLLKTAKENKTLSQRVASMEQQISSLKKDNAVKWFLAGGGVLLVGMFLGMLSSRSRKKKSSLL